MGGNYMTKNIYILFPEEILLEVLNESDEEKGGKLLSEFIADNQGIFQEVQKEIKTAKFDVKIKIGSGSEGNKKTQGDSGEHNERLNAVKLMIEERILRDLKWSKLKDDDDEGENEDDDEGEDEDNDVTLPMDISMNGKKITIEEKDKDDDTEQARVYRLEINLNKVMEAFKNRLDVSITILQQKIEDTRLNSREKQQRLYAVETILSISSFIEDNNKNKGKPFFQILKRDQNIYQLLIQKISEGKKVVNKQRKRIQSYLEDVTDVPGFAEILLDTHEKKEKQGNANVLSGAEKKMTEWTVENKKNIDREVLANELYPRVFSYVFPEENTVRAEYLIHAKKGELWKKTTLPIDKQKEFQRVIKEITVPEFRTRGRIRVFCNKYERLRKNRMQQRTFLGIISGRLKKANRDLDDFVNDSAGEKDGTIGDRPTTYQESQNDFRKLNEFKKFVEQHKAVQKKLSLGDNLFSHVFPISIISSSTSWLVDVFKKKPALITGSELREQLCEQLEQLKRLSAIDEFKAKELQENTLLENTLVIPQNLLSKFNLPSTAMINNNLEQKPSLSDKKPAQKKRINVTLKQKEINAPSANLILNTQDNKNKPKKDNLISVEFVEVSPKI